MPKKKPLKANRSLGDQPPGIINIDVSNIENSKINIVNRDMITLRIDGQETSLPETLESIVGKTELPDLNNCLTDYLQVIIHNPALSEIDKHSICLNANVGADRIPIGELLAQNQRLVVTGSPGSGKTIFLLQILKSYCERISTNLLKKADLDIPIPFYIELGMLAQRARNRTGALSPSRLISEEILRLLGVQPSLHPEDLIKKIIDQYKLFLLLDGLNEVPPDFRESISAYIVSLDTALGSKVYERVTILVTSRSYGFVDRFSRYGYLIAELSPLNAEEIEAEFHKHVYRSKGGPDFTFQSVDPRTRQLLSTPQHLDYYLTWYLEQFQKGNPENVERKISQTKAHILRFFCEKKLETLSPQKSLIINQILGKLGYQCVTRSLYFPASEAFTVINDILQKAKVNYEPDQLLDDILVSGLLVYTVDKFRFSHHSIQQYYAACWMVNEKDSDKFINSEIWHEPLVIMAGLLNKHQLKELLRQIQHEKELYAYILSNIDEAELERAFTQELVKDFIALTWNWRRQLVRALVIYFIVWFILLPVSGISLMMTENLPLQILLVALGIVYLAVVPIGLISIHKRRTRIQIERLTNTVIPQIIVLFKFLMAKGALQVVYNQLSLMRSSIKDYQADDPGHMLINSGIEKIRQAINIPVFMSTDEMISHLGDPLVVALIELNQLTTKGFDTLCSIATDLGNDLEAFESLKLLSAIFQKDPESREIISELLEKIINNDGYSNRRKKKVLKISKDLGLDVKRRHNLRQDRFIQFLKFLLSIFRK